MNIASFYGATGLLYHVTQSLPILLLPIWYWWAKGYAAALLPSSMLPASLAALDRPERLRTLARAVSFTLATLSLSPHSEWRFAHPLLPLLLLFAIPALQAAYAPPMVGCHHPMRAFRQYFRLPRGAFYTILLVPLLPYLYLNTFHGAAQVSVMSSLRRGEFGAVDTLAVLMPCHSTPWASHLGSVARDSWFLTCEPPLARDGEDDNEKAEKFQHVTQQDLFYTSPVSYITTVFPYAPNPLGRAAVSAQAPDLPSHVLLFGCVLDHVEDGVRFADALGERGYVQVAALWNGFDVLQDEEKRRGGVRVWRRERAGRERDGNSW
jgi:phosphatidylinositol glycan class B